MVTKYKKEHPGEKTIKIFRPHEKDCVWFHFQTWFFTFIKKLIDNFHILGVISYFSTGFHTRLQLILTRFIHIINYINLRLFFFFFFFWGLFPIFVFPPKVYTLFECEIIILKEKKSLDLNKLVKLHPITKPRRKPFS